MENETDSYNAYKSRTRPEISCRPCVGQQMVRLEANYGLNEIRNEDVGDQGIRVLQTKGRRNKNK
jgi:hypothetical protein